MGTAACCCSAPPLASPVAVDHDVAAIRGRVDSRIVALSRARLRFVLRGFVFASAPRLIGAARTGRRHWLPRRLARIHRDDRAHEMDSCPRKREREEVSNSRVGDIEVALECEMQ